MLFDITLDSVLGLVAVLAGLVMIVRMPTHLFEAECLWNSVTRGQQKTCIYSIGVAGLGVIAMVAVMCERLLIGFTEMESVAWKIFCVTSLLPLVFTYARRNDLQELLRRQH